MTGGEWSVVVPVKRLSTAKSRLGGSRALRTAVATAVALDTMETVARCPEVGQLLVVTRDGEAAAAAAQLGAAVVRERRHTVDPLNTSIASALRWLTKHRSASPVAVVPTDLASLTTPVLMEVLRMARSHDQAFVRDLAGTGTTIWSAITPRTARPRYGVGSAAKHAAAGATELTGLPREVRHDLDAYQDVGCLLALGVGPRLRHALNVTWPWQEPPALQPGTPAQAPMLAVEWEHWA